MARRNSRSQNLASPASPPNAEGPVQACDNITTTCFISHHPCQHMACTAQPGCIPLHKWLHRTGSSYWCSTHGSGRRTHTAGPAANHRGGAPADVRSRLDCGTRCPKKHSSHHISQVSDTTPIYLVLLCLDSSRCLPSWLRIAVKLGGRYLYTAHSVVCSNYQSRRSEFSWLRPTCSGLARTLSASRCFPLCNLSLRVGRK